MIKNDALLIDIGGTKTELEFKNVKTKYENKSFKSFEELMKFYLTNNPMSPQALAIAAAGPVQDNICKLTNLPWVINLEKIRNSFFPYLSEDKTFLLNDLEAFAWYPKSLQKFSQEIIKITKDTSWMEKGNYAVISVGTGLGVAMSFYNKKQDTYQIIPTECGHSIRTMDNTKRTWEDLLSGEGLVNLYNFLENNLDKIKNTKELAILAELKDPLALKAIDTFFYNLAFFAQNMALIGFPQKGIYLSGGILAAFLKFTDPSIFINTFRDNRKMKDLLLDIPLYLIEDSAPIKGLRNL